MASKIVTHIFALVFCLQLGQPVAAQSEHPCHDTNPNTEPKISIIVCTDLIISDTKDPVIISAALTKRGIAYRELGQYPQSLNDLITALEHVENDTTILRMLAWTYREAGQLNKAEKIYTQVLATDDHWQGWLSRCAVRTDLKRYESAIEDCDIAAKRISDSDYSIMHDILYFKSLSLNELGRWDEAYAAASSGFSDSDVTGRLYYEALIALWSSKRHKEIRPILEEGLQRYPNDLDILHFKKLLKQQ